MRPRGRRTVRLLDLGDDERIQERTIDARRLRCDACGTTWTDAPRPVQGTNMTTRLATHVAGLYVDGGLAFASETTGIRPERILTALDGLVTDAVVEAGRTSPLVARCEGGIVGLSTKDGTAFAAFLGNRRSETRARRICSLLDATIVCDEKARTRLLASGVDRSRLRLHRRSMASEVRRICSSVWSRLSRTARGTGGRWFRMNAAPPIGTDDTMPRQAKAFVSFQERLVAAFMQRTAAEGAAMVAAVRSSLTGQVAIWFEPILRFIDRRAPEVFDEEAWNAVGLRQWMAARPSVDLVPTLELALTLTLRPILAPTPSPPGLRLEPGWRRQNRS